MDRHKLVKALLAMRRMNQSVERDEIAVAEAEAKVKKSQRQRDVHEILSSVEKVLSGIQIPKEFR